MPTSSLHVEELAGLLYFSDLREVVLVGHSYGGLPVSGAAARYGARIARLIYLDAFVAADGQSLFDLLRPDRRKFYEESAVDGLVPSPPPEAFGVVEQRDWVGDRLTPQPLRTFTEPLSVCVGAAGPAHLHPLHRGPDDGELRRLRPALPRHRGVGRRGLRFRP